MRVIWSDNGVLSDKTEDARTWGNPAIAAPFVAAEDALYIGRPYAFNYLYLQMATGNATAAGMSVSYWDAIASAWKPFSDLTDETDALAKSGFVHWKESVDLASGVSINWAKKAPAAVSGLESLTTKQELFWIRIKLSADASAGTSIQAIKTLLSDDRLMEVAFPEILRYLPNGETSFLKQHELAKDAIVNYLIVKGLISYEEQLKNPEDWMLAATYKCIELVLAPIAGNPELAAVKNDMATKAKDHMLMSAASIDTNKNQVLDSAEKKENKEPASVRYMTR